MLSVRGSVRGVGTLLVVAVALVCHTNGVTLPDGFYIDESKFVTQTSRAVGIGGKCSGANRTECSDDCTSLLTCDKNGIVTSSAKCNSQYAMYCVKKGYHDECSFNFPISNQQCFNYAYNNFECTGDGVFPDPTDGTKYHECSGTTHTIRECEGNYRFWYDAKSLSEPTTNGNFTCRYFNEQTCQSSFPTFICNNSPNTYTFRGGDMHYYAYCMTLATTSKTLLFRCPAGTVHNSKMNAEKQVVCAPPV